MHGFVELEYSFAKTTLSFNRSFSKEARNLRKIVKNAVISVSV